MGNHPLFLLSGSRFILGNLMCSNTRKSLSDVRETPPLTGFMSQRGLQNYKKSELCCQENLVYRLKKYFRTFRLFHHSISVSFSSQALLHLRVCLSFAFFLSFNTINIVSSCYFRLLRVLRSKYRRGNILCLSVIKCYSKK